MIAKTLLSLPLEQESISAVLLTLVVALPLALVALVIEVVVMVVLWLLGMGALGLWRGVTAPRRRRQTRRQQVESRRQVIATRTARAAALRAAVAKRDGVDPHQVWVEVGRG